MRRCTAAAYQYRYGLLASQMMRRGGGVLELIVWLVWLTRDTYRSSADAAQRSGVVIRQLRAPSRLPACLPACLASPASRERGAKEAVRSHEITQSGPAYSPAYSPAGRPAAKGERLINIYKQPVGRGPWGWLPSAAGGVDVIGRELLECATLTLRRAASYSYSRAELVGNKEDALAGCSS